jgi:hypothetical protein
MLNLGMEASTDLKWISIKINMGSSLLKEKVILIKNLSI